MEIVDYFLYILVLNFIETYKWLELQFLKLFVPYITRVGIKIAEKFGIVLHFEAEENKNDPKWSSENENRIMKKTKGRYDRLVHLNVKDPKQFLLRAVNRGTLGLGEAYMDGVWDPYGDVSDIAEAATRVFQGNLLDIYWNKWNLFLDWLELSAFNLQTPERAFQIGRAHYDLGNNLFESMLDPWMQYSCGYWAKADNLNQAQKDKMELIAKKLDLQPGMRVLDIGCGWGTLCKYFAQNYGVTCVGVTVSKEGVAYAKEINQGLPVEIRLQDYRELDEKFDRIVSVGMFEHVGYKNHKEFMKVVRRCLVDDGIFLLHTIGKNHANVSRSEPFSHRYIFPNGNLPKPFEIAKATEGLFILEDWHNFALDYAKTLQAWRANFIKAWPKLEDNYAKQVNGKFYRMWIIYLCAAEAFFRSRKLQLWQVLLTPDGFKRDFRAAR